MNPRLTIVIGPTAGGKSDLAVALARRAGGTAAGGEVISADSMQVYRHLDAGTAKPGADLRAAAPHHLIDVVEPTEPFTVADWLARAEPLIDGLLARGVSPIVVGGTNLYLQALLLGLFAGPPADPAVRAELDRLGNPALHAELAAVDRASAARIHPNDRKKLLRALEVWRATGRPMSAWQTQWDEESRMSDVECRMPEPRYRRDPLLIGLNWPVDAINRRINARVKEMFFPSAEPGTRTPEPESLPAEVARLFAAGLLGTPRSAQANEALGYKQVLAALRGEMSMADAFEQTKIQTRRFAKRQRTWLKRFRGVCWLDPVGRTPDELAAEALAGDAGSAR